MLLGLCAEVQDDQQTLAELGKESRDTVSVALVPAFKYI